MSKARGRHWPAKGMAELLEMMVNGWRPLFCFGGVAGKDLPTGDDPAIDLIQPDFVAKLGLFARLLAPNDGRMRLKEADKLRGGREQLPPGRPAAPLGQALVRPRGR